MPRLSNNLTFFRKEGGLSPDDSAELDRWGKHPAFARFKDEDPLNPFREYRKILAKHGSASLEALDQREKVTLANMRLVFKVARHFANRGMPVADLIQEGFMGLSVAVEKFDPDRGYQFSTYASWWIWSYVSRAVMDQSTSRVMRVPIHHQELERQIAREEARFLQVNGRVPDDDELGKEFGRKLKLIRSAPFIGASVSMDAPTHSEDERPFGEKFSSDQYSPETLTLARSHLPRMLKEIDEICRFDGGNADRNSAVMRMRYGLAPYREPATLQEVGEAFHITRERVRQIICKRLKDYSLSETEFKKMLENLQTVREALEATR